MLWFVPLLILGQSVFFASNDQVLRHNFAVHGWSVLTLPFWITVLGMMLCIVMYPVAILNQRMRFQKSSFSVGPTTVVADDEGISGTTAKSRDMFSWPTIRHILETETYFFVLSAPRAGLIIPKRAFESPAQCAEFGALLQRKWAEHHPDAAPIASARLFPANEFAFTFSATPAPNRRSKRYTPARCANSDGFRATSPRSCHAICRSRPRRGCH